ncbi:MAG: BatD family protein, partial [Tannerella sp.]|nr:BatD family protein [Tannerella sp.]
MNKSIILIILILSASTGVQLKAEDVTFRASAPNAVVIGTQFQLVFEVNVLNGTDLRLPPSITENFDNLMGPSVSTSQSFQTVNNKTTSKNTVTYTYIFAAKKEGTFTVDPATINVGNAEYKSNALTIKVLPPDKAAQAQGGGAQQQNDGGASAASISNDNIFMRMIVSNRNVYEQEGFLVSFKLYTTLNIEGINNPKFPEFEGFFSQEIELKDVQWELENYNGRNYNTAVMKQVILYPQRSGQIKIGSAKVDAIVRVRNRARGGGFFEDFFDTYQRVSKELVSSAATIDVKPLPSGKPASFSGAVGDYTMSSTISRTELKANEAITIKIIFKGNGNIKLLKNPEIKFPNDFEPYDPKVDYSTKVAASGVSGTKTIEYMAIPRYAGDFEIPAVGFSYFDTKSGAYKSLSTETYNIHVEKGEGESDAPVMSNY